MTPIKPPDHHPCECGDRFVWQNYGFFTKRWRLECICGRAGPWRSDPIRKAQLSPAMPDAPLGAPPPPIKTR